MLQSQLPTKVYKTGRTVISWKDITTGFEVEVNEQKFIVVSNTNVEKVSKTSGKGYKTRRLVIADINGNEMEVGADSFKKGSFIKRFNKQYPPMEKVQEVVEEPQVEVAEVEEPKTLAEQIEEPTFKKIVIDLTEEQVQDEEPLEQMTVEEQVAEQNRFYELLTERGLLQVYSDMEHGKEVSEQDKRAIRQVEEDMIDEQINWDELEQMMKEEESKDKVQEIEEGKKIHKKTLATRLDILKAQEQMKAEPEYINAKSWSYEVL